jgi:hypothetical protein
MPSNVTARAKCRPASSSCPEECALSAVVPNSYSSPAPSKTAKPSATTPMPRRIMSTISPTPKKCDPAQTINVPLTIAIVSGRSIPSTTRRASNGRCGKDRRIASAILSAFDMRRTDWSDMVRKSIKQSGCVAKRCRHACGRPGERQFPAGLRVRRRGGGSSTAAMLRITTVMRRAACVHWSAQLLFCRPQRHNPPPPIAASRPSLDPPACSPTIPADPSKSPPEFPTRNHDRLQGECTEFA